jgi:phage tail-like protein
LTDDMQAWIWRKEVEDGKVTSARVNGSILMTDQDPSTVIAEFNFINAWPLKVSGPAPNANSSDLAMEEVELICEQVIRVT